MERPDGQLKVPNHIGVIIDGNRRWAEKKGLPFPWLGHRAGAQTLDHFLHWCLELGVPNISVYMLSTENLNRPKQELEELFDLYYKYLKKWTGGEKDSILDKYEVHVRCLGDLNRLPLRLRKISGKLMRKTAKYQKKFLNLMIAYGSKFELTEVIKKIARRAIKAGRIEITARDVEKNLLVPVPLDLVIRTGGMKRLSNFLLWQASYAELIFLDKLWPDFTKEDLIWCIEEFNRRQRNFGK